MAFMGEMHYLTIGGKTYKLPSSGGNGTVTSVGVANATNGGLLVSGSPITTAGTITIGLASGYGDTKNPYASKTKNYVLASPATANGVPTFRALVASDIPALNYVSPEDLPTSTESSTTGITATTTATKTTLGTANSVTGVKSGTNSTTTASKASGGNGSASTWTFEEKTIPNVTAAGSGSFTSTVTNHVLSFSHTHTAPTIGTAIKVQSKSGGGNGTAPTWSFTDVTVPIRADSATSVPNVSVASATVSISDPGHTHSI